MTDALGDGKPWRTLWVLLLLSVASLPHWRCITPHEPLTLLTEYDGYLKLQGVARSSLGDAVGWFFGDDPQRGHSFRPIPALSLWLEYQLWGWRRAPYQVVNLIYLVLTGLALVVLGRSLRLPEPAALALGLALLALPTQATRVEVLYIATRSDLLCGLTALLAVAALARHLDGDPRALGAYVAWSLAAYLCKEHAVMLLPIGLAVAALDRDEPLLRRRAAFATVGVAALWFVWHGLAELNMTTRDIHPGHTFTAQGLLLRRGWRLSAWAYLANTCTPLSTMLAMLLGPWDPQVLWNPDLWRQLVELGLMVAGLTILYVADRRTLVLLLAWKLLAYLPVLPFHDRLPWYLFIPHLLDRLLPVAGVARWWTLRTARGIRSPAG